MSSNPRVVSRWHDRCGNTSPVANGRAGLDAGAFKNRLGSELVVLITRFARFGEHPARHVDQHSQRIEAESFRRRNIPGHVRRRLGKQSRIIARRFTCAIVAEAESFGMDPQRIPRESDSSGLAYRRVRSRRKATSSSSPARADR